MPVAQDGELQSFGASRLLGSARAFRWMFWSLVPLPLAVPMMLTDVGPLLLLGGGLCLGGGLVGLGFALRSRALQLLCGLVALMVVAALYLGARHGVALREPIHGLWLAGHGLTLLALFLAVVACRSFPEATRLPCLWRGQLFLHGAVAALSLACSVGTLRGLAEINLFAQACATGLLADGLLRSGALCAYAGLGLPPVRPDQDDAVREALLPASAALLLVTSGSFAYGAAVEGQAFGPLFTVFAFGLGGVLVTGLVAHLVWWHQFDLASRSLRGQWVVARGVPDELWRIRFGSHRGALIAHDGCWFLVPCVGSPLNPALQVEHAIAISPAELDSVAPCPPDTLRAWALELITGRRALTFSCADGERLIFRGVGLRSLFARIEAAREPREVSENSAA